jgi:hypothetical protein
MFSILLLRLACEAGEVAVTQSRRIVSMGYTVYWWAMRFRAWLLILALVILGATMSWAMGAD